MNTQTSQHLDNLIYAHSIHGLVYVRKGAAVQKSMSVRSRFATQEGAGDTKWCVWSLWSKFHHLFVTQTPQQGFPYPKEGTGLLALLCRFVENRAFCFDSWNRDKEINHLGVRCSEQHTFLAGNVPYQPSIAWLLASVYLAPHGITVHLGLLVLVAV